MLSHIITETEWAWLAGFVDGEGSICIFKRRLREYTAYHMVLSISNTRKDVLEWVAVKFGGTVRQNNKARGNCKACYSWRAGDCASAFVLRGIYPYLLLKKSQAEIGIRFLSTISKTGRRGTPLHVRAIRYNLRQQLHVLNARGVQPAQELDVAPLSVCNQLEFPAEREAN